MYGFLGGPHGVYSHEYRELSQETIDHYRNMGGFDMIRSGRHKIETDEQKQQSLEICQKLGLNGLVVIGGDDSNTNAAILAEYFKVKKSQFPLSADASPKCLQLISRNSSATMSRCMYLCTHLACVHAEWVGAVDGG